MTTAGSPHQTSTVDREKAGAFQHRCVEDFASLVAVACGALGDRLGLYKAMHELGAATADQIAARAGCNARYVREWLLNQAASGYVRYESDSQEFVLPAEHAEVLCNDNSPYFAAGGFETYLALLQSYERLVDCFKTGKGLSWGEHDPHLFSGTERFFRTAYKNVLVQKWIPDAPELQSKLERGAKVADVGCGHGISTVEMAQAFPASKFYGFDNHAPSIEQARKVAAAGGLSERITYEVASAAELPGSDYDVVAFFDCLHDMGDPQSACRRVAQILKPDGLMVLVEPMGGRTLEENFNLVGRVYTGASVLCCTPAAMASGPTQLGTVATDSALESVVKAGGFKTFKRATETPFNRVFIATL
ncbi:MAG: class I SAM-dependent methyltransferase [Candidatus Obscuribacterales bacterium]